MKKLITEVYCTLQVEATHQWNNCPFDEVAYLRDPHRHMFGIKAYMPVSHSDRDVEFILLKHKIAEYIKNKYWDDQQKLCVFGAMSCEMLGAELIQQFNLSAVEVTEDNENGSFVAVV